MLDTIKTQYLTKHLYNVDNIYLIQEII